jgi:hypothetical protein
VKVSLGCTKRMLSTASTKSSDGLAMHERIKNWKKRQKQNL